MLARQSEADPHGQDVRAEPKYELPNGEVYVEESYVSIILYPLFTLYTPLLPYMHLYTPVIHVYTPYIHLTRL